MATSLCRTGMYVEEIMHDTVAEVLASLGCLPRGRLTANGLVVAGADDAHSVEPAIVDYRFRFEGSSDLADEAIVIPASCTGSSRKTALADPSHRS